MAIAIREARAPTADELQYPDQVTISPGSTMTFLPPTHEYDTCTIIEADAAPLYVPPHSHRTHIEIFFVAEGDLQVTVGKRTIQCTVQDGPIYIQPGTKHTFQSVPGKRAVLYERSEPRDASKIAVFRNLTDGGYERASKSILRTAIAFYSEGSGDTYPWLGGIRWLEALLIYLLGAVLAPLFGHSIRYKHNIDGLKKMEKN